MIATPPPTPVSYLESRQSASGGFAERGGSPSPQLTARWLKVLAGLLAVFWGFLFYGLIDLLAFAQGPDFHASLVLSTGWGVRVYSA